jgi:exopolysaccharide production protein ExoY
MSQIAFAGTGRYAATDWTRMQALAIDRRLDGRQPDWPVEMVSKRMLDALFAAILLVLLSPLMLWVALVVRRDGAPAIFGHKRIGADGRSFTCWKFRSMVPDADKVLERILAEEPALRAEWEREYKLHDDPRITRIGQFLRQTSLDELPQLFNVLKGEMSLVGPRPIVRDEIKRYGAAFHDYMRCRPGITGKWQVSGRNDIDYRTRVVLDRDYARGWSLINDIAILLLTPLVVLQRKGAC